MMEDTASIGYFRTHFVTFYNAVKASHVANAAKNRGHDLAHDATVGQYCMLIAENERTGQLARIAAYLHSMDYWVNRNEEAFKELIRQHIGFLPQGEFTQEELIAIADAAVRHGEKNQDDQGPVQRTLMDADRLSILMPDVLFRIGKGYPTLPAVEFQFLAQNNPMSTYAIPFSCLDDLRNCIIEFVPKFRLPKARAMFADQVANLETIIGMIQSAYSRVGLVDVLL